MDQLRVAKASPTFQPDLPARPFSPNFQARPFDLRGREGHMHLSFIF